MRLTFSSDKNRYNKFPYKIKLVPTEMRTQWQVIRSQEATCPDSFDAFVNDVIAYEVNERTSKKRVIKDVMENTSAGEWMPWHEVVGKEGMHDDWSTVIVLPPTKGSWEFIHIYIHIYIYIYIYIYI